MADSDMEAPEDGNKACDLSMAGGFGAAIGIIVGAVVFAITQNPFWIAIKTHLRCIREHFTGRLSENQLRQVADGLETITGVHQPH